MQRLIDADVLDNALTKLRFNADGELAHWGDRKDWCLHGSEIEKLIADAPTVEAEPVKRGRWIKVEDDYNNHLYECSYCHTWTSLPTEDVNDGSIRYCWSCGAKMYR